MLLSKYNFDAQNKTISFSKQSEFEFESTRKFKLG